jgi:hypothetical protein
VLGQKLPKAGVHIDRRFQKTHIEGSSTLGERTLEESPGGKFETSEAQRFEVIHSCRSVGGHLLADHELRVKAFQEYATEES